jgi:hypothetical protein
VPAGPVGLLGLAAGDWDGEPGLAQAHCCPVPGSGCCCCGCLGAEPAGNCSIQVLALGPDPGPAVAGPDLCGLCCCCCLLPAEAVALPAGAVAVFALGLCAQSHCLLLAQFLLPAAQPAGLLPDLQVLLA